jgi:hypothetical protein
MFIKFLVNRISEMNTALVHLKVEMAVISHGASAYQTEFDKILKAAKTLKDVFSGINKLLMS